MTHTIKHYILLLITAVFFMLTVPVVVNGQSIDTNVEQELFGWAWSDTIGWISMNCANLDECGSSDYRVRRVPGPGAGNPNGSLEGYAWSERIGWIQFREGLSGWPSGFGGNANLMVVDGGTVARAGGWARAAAGQDFNDGWDGWILLRSDSFPEFGVRFLLEQDGDLRAGRAAADSYAWGGEVVGWVDFSGVTIGIPPDPDAAPDVDLTGTTCVIPAGQNSCNGTISWEFFNLPPDDVDIRRRNNPTFVPGGEIISENVLQATNESVRLYYGINRFQARNEGTQVGVQLRLDTECADDTEWNGSICQLIDPDLPDLIIYSSEGSLPDTSVITATEAFPSDTFLGTRSVRFRYSIENIGATSTISQRTDGVQGRFIVQDVSPGRGVDEQNNRNVIRSTAGPIDVGSASRRPVSYNQSGFLFGIYDVTAFADPNARIDEEDDTNNDYGPVRHTIRPPDPNMTLTVNPRIIRSGSEATLTWDRNTEYNMDCVITGAGVGGLGTNTFSTNLRTGNRQLENRRSTSEYVMVCTEPITNTEFRSNTARLEVLPSLEEI